MRRRLVVGIVLLLLAGAGVWYARGLIVPAHTEQMPSEQQQKRPKSKNAKLIRNKPKRPATPKNSLLRASKVRAIAISEDAEFTPAEQKTADALQEALDNEDFKGVLAQLKDAGASKNPALRTQAVEALGWFGEKALPELTPFLADADADVRESALSAVDQALMQVENEQTKVKYIESIMMLKNVCDEDGVSTLSATLNGVEDESLSVAAAVRVIRASTNPAAVSAMKEFYEFTTGDPYTTPEAAEQWCVKYLADNADNQ